MLEMKTNIIKLEFGFNFFCLLTEKGEVLKIDQATQI